MTSAVGRTLSPLSRFSVVSIISGFIIACSSPLWYTHVSVVASSGGGGVSFFRVLRVNMLVVNPNDNFVRAILPWRPAMTSCLRISMFPDWMMSSNAFTEFVALASGYFLKIPSSQKKWLTSIYLTMKFILSVRCCSLLATKSPNVSSDFAFCILFLRWSVNDFLSLSVESGTPFTSKISSETALYCLSI